MEDQKPDLKNVVTDAIAKIKVEYAIAKLKADIADRSFSGRHPELGKMINCPVCQARHRSSQVCHQKFVVELVPPDGLTQLTKKQVYGAAAFAKKRTRPHHSHILLRLVGLTQDLFPKYYPDQISDPEKAMRAARGEARAILLRGHRKHRRTADRISKESRRINRSA